MKLEPHQVFAASRICRNMTRGGYRDKEISLILHALYLTATRQDMREAWWVINRRHLAQMPRAEVQSTLLDVLGPEARPQLVASLDKLAKRPQLSMAAGGTIDFGGGGSEQQVGFAEFSQVMKAVAGAASGERVLDFVAAEVSAAASSAAGGVHAMLTELQVIDSSLTAKIPPTALARAGVIAERMLVAGYSQRQVNNAIACLFVSRDERSLVKLWGTFDKTRAGVISTDVFDRAMLLFSDALDAEQLPELRSQLGFVAPGEVTLRQSQPQSQPLFPTLIPNPNSQP
tara:strand:+ start:15 stop:875 length:861 start_codon:yes stop_codon:yes gene_type:complete